MTDNRTYSCMKLEDAVKRNIHIQKKWSEKL